MDFGTFPTNAPLDTVAVFYDQGFITATTPTVQTWIKPKWAKTIDMICIGSGASGAGGTSRASLAASIGAGGGGGGCSGVSRLTIPAIFVPNQLYISVGPARSGGAANAAGQAGIHSVISSVPGQIVAANCFLQSGNAVPPAPAIAGTTGAAGAAGTIAAVANCVLAHNGVFLATVSIAGGAGGITGSAASNVNAMGGSFLTGGTGGGGTRSGQNDLTAGGNITAVGPVPQQPGGVASGGDGRRGFWSWAPFCGSGGTGGGSSPVSGVGGAGGHGAYGCGGGGGGTGVTGGRGGSSGPGLVIIICS